MKTISPNVLQSERSKHLKLPERVRTYMKRIILLFCLVSLFIFLLASSCGPARKPAVILWDTWGIPHIYADTEEDLFYALGWAQMQNHGNLILENYGKSRGRAAEYWGERYLDIDQYVRTMGIRELAAKTYQEAPDEELVEINAFAKGMNDYAQEQPEKLDDRLEIVLPISGQDVMTYILYAAYFGIYVPPDMIDGVRQQYPGQGKATNSEPDATPTSNAWAIGPSKSSSGHPILLSNPHAPWPNLPGQEHLIFFEAHLVGSDFNIYGIGLVGIPGLAFGFNDFKGWTFTSTPLDVVDFYELTLTEGGYLFDGEVKAFDAETHRIKIKQENGSFREEVLEVQSSIHGPVIINNGDKAVAVKVPLPADPLKDQFWNMAKAENLDEFFAALEPQEIGSTNILYADKQGNIMYTLAGIFPDRPEGDYDWSGIVPGNTSATLWKGKLPFNSMPKVINPDTGYLQNSNEPPWTVTIPCELDPADFPADWPGLELYPRGIRSLEMITSRDTFNIEDIMVDKYSTHSLIADRVLDDLVAAASHSESEVIQEAAGVLSMWDRTFDADSTGAVLFTFWAMQYEPEILGNALLPEDVYAVSSDPLRPFETPSGLAEPEQAVAALEAAAHMVKGAFGSLYIPWGEFYRFRIGEQDLPGFGVGIGPGNFGTFVPNVAMPQEDGRLATVYSDAWAAIIEFSNPVRATAVMPYSSSTQEGSPHYNDQLILFAGKEYRSVWLTRGDIEANLELRYVFEK
jgi:acyl-homoserine-lactone acylase